MEPGDIQQVVQEAIGEFLKKTQEPAAKAELGEERRRREQTERRMNELLEENERYRKTAEQTERSSTIKGELQRLGVKKPELAFRLVKDEVFRGEDGHLYARSEEGPVGLREYLAQFVAENPEFLPARIAGGSGASSANRAEPEGGGFDLSRIRPGMSDEEKQRARREIARAAGKDVLGWL